MEPVDFRDAMVRWRLSRLRRLTARPFGLVPSAALPMPVDLGSESWRRAGLARQRVGVTSYDYSGVPIGWLRVPAPQ